MVWMRRLMCLYYERLFGAGNGIEETYEGLGSAVPYFQMVV